MSFLVKFVILTLAWTFVRSNPQRNKLFFLQKSSGDETETLLVVTWKQGIDEISAVCEIFTDKYLIIEVLKSSGGAHIRTIPDDEMENLLGDCTEFSSKIRKRERDQESPSKIAAENIEDNARDLCRCRISQGTRSETTESQEDRIVNDSDVMNAGRNTTEAPTTPPGYGGWLSIFPGTKWCGSGDIAKDYNDLGQHEGTDRCCRAHDHCNGSLAPGETRNNLTNYSSFTKLSCKCDNAFFSCLSRENSVTSNAVGSIYFNILRRECYKKDYPATKKCKKYRTFFKTMCLEYEKDMNAEPVYQWVPSKEYKKTPSPGLLNVTLPF